MKISIANYSALVVIFLFAISPILGWFTFSYLGKTDVQILYLLCVLSFFLILLENLKVPFPPYLILYTLFTLYSILSDLILASKSFNISYIWDNSFISGLIILIIIEYADISRKYLDRIFKVSLLVIIIAFIVILLQQFYSPLFMVRPDMQILYRNVSFEESRLSSIYTWTRSSLTEIGLCFFPVMALLTGDMIKNDRKGVLPVLLIGALTAFFNKSRYVMLNFGIILILYPIYKGFNVGKIFKYAAIAILISVLSYYGLKSTGYKVDRVINERILEKGAHGLAHSNAGTRILAFKVFAELFPKNPFFGKGYIHSFGKEGSSDYDLVRALAQRSSQIHVGYLSLFYYYGLVGGILYVSFLILLTKKLYNDAKFTGYWGPFIGWTMFLVTNLTGVSLDIFRMGIVLVLVVNQYYLQQKISSTINT
jgi:hypothetical protein